MRLEDRQKNIAEKQSTFTMEANIQYTLQSESKEKSKTSTILPPLQYILILQMESRA